MPHAGDWRSADVIAQAYDLNVPLRTTFHSPTGGPASRAGEGPAAFGLLAVRSDSVVLDTLKRAEDGDGWVLRAFEAKGSRLHGVELSFSLPLKRAALCDLLENELEELGLGAAGFASDATSGSAASGTASPDAGPGSTVSLSFSPFEIVTLRVWF